jgi:hypothetical protein
VSLGFHEVSFDGAMLTRGFWLYVWEIVVDDGRTLYYVGKTGDKASGASQSPFDRLSKHLGSNLNNNALRRHLGKGSINPERCKFVFRACGPLYNKDSTKPHGELCDITSALERALADLMHAAGYTVINNVNCRMPLDKEAFNDVRRAFGAAFPRLLTGSSKEC